MLEKEQDHIAVPAAALDAFGTASSAVVQQNSFRFPKRSECNEFPST